MKSFFKNLTKLGLIAAALVFSVRSEAQNIQPFALTNGVNLVLSGKQAVDEINITDSSGFASTLLILDNSSSTSTNTVKPTYLSYAYARGTNVTTFTNAAGVVQTNNYVYISRSVTTNAAVTNVAHVVYRSIIPANGTITVLPNTAFTFGYGVQMLLVGNTTNTPSAGGTMSYTPQP